MPSLKSAWNKAKKTAKSAVNTVTSNAGTLGAAAVNPLTLGTGLAGIGAGKEIGPAGVGIALSPLTFGPGYGWFKGAQAVGKALAPHVGGGGGGGSAPQAQPDAGPQMPALPQYDDPGNSVFSGIADYQSVFPVKAYKRGRNAAQVGDALAPNPAEEFNFQVT